MAVDLGILQNQKTLSDYVGARQQMAEQQQQAYQQNQLGNLDLQSKKNIYATQLLSSAVDQPSYDMVRQHLQQAGIDTSNFAPDFATGKQQAYQARLAQSPLGSLLNAGMKAEGILNSGAATFGSAGAAASQDPMSAALARGIGGMMGGAVQNAPAQGAQAPTQSNAMPLTQANDYIPGNPDIAPASAPQNSPPQMPQSLQQLPGESASAYQNRVANDPGSIAAREKAKAAGTAAGALPERAATSQEITDRLTKNVQKLLTINPDTPDSSYMSPETKAWWSKRYGSGKDAGKLAEWNQVDQQQILSDYGQLVSSGAIKGSRAIFQALQTGSGVPADEPISARTDLLNNLLAEIQNKNVTAQNLNADINGGAKQPYGDIPTAITGANGWSVKRVK